MDSRRSTNEIMRAMVEKEVNYQEVMLVSYEFMRDMRLNFNFNWPHHLLLLVTLTSWNFFVEGCTQTEGGGVYR